MTTKWWHLGTDEVVRTLETDAKAGLRSAVADEKLRTARPERAPGKEGPRSPGHLPRPVQEPHDRGPHRRRPGLRASSRNGWTLVAILAIVILNAVLGLVQEYRAEKSLAALKRLSAPSSKVVRGRRHPGSSRPARLVPGDLVEVEAGDHVPADSRVVWHTSNFAVQEASLTGESTPVDKTDIALEEKDVPLAERANILYMGTSVVAGKARAIVVETGMQTELGRIAGLIQGIKKETTPLQEKLEQFGKFLVYLCFVLVAIVFGLEVAARRQAVHRRCS
ncbi:MAG: hypothetical protein MZV70_52805 [Desulfobacterales bacterium]|nr:hypothetical protein [Desulfobacterales bacterium]